MKNYFNIFDDANLAVIFRKADPDLWAATYASLPFRPLDYLASSLDYQLAYQRGHGGMWEDLSCILHANGKPVGIWPITLSKQENSWNISSHGMPIMPPLFVDQCPSSIIKKLTKNCLDVLNYFAIQFELKNWVSSFGFIERMHCSDWELLLMRDGAYCEVHHELYIDLTKSLAEIKASFRRSYRSLVNSGEREWTVDVLRAPGNHKIWSEFRCLHAEVSGRVTRCSESWDQQYTALQRGEAFLIFLRNSNGRMVGGGYFMNSDDEGVYAVGAYDRNLFHKPLGHVVQYKAIDELKNRGCRWYRLGRRIFSSSTPSPSDKDLSIAHFKEGFATHVFRSFSFCRTVS